MYAMSLSAHKLISNNSSKAPLHHHFLESTSEKMDDEQ